MEWVEEYIIGNPLGALIGGALLYYLIKLWLEYIQSKQNVGSLTTQSTFITQVNTEDYGFKKLNQSIQSRALHPSTEINPQILSMLFGG